MEDGGSDGLALFVRGVIVHPSLGKDTYACAWDVTNNVGVTLFTVGSTIWFSRSHSQRDGVSRSADEIAVNDGRADISFPYGKAPDDLYVGEWRVNRNYDTFSLN